MNFNKLLLPGAGMVLVTVTALGRMAPETQPMPAGAVVVAELFTSEGCSSCPPADEVLSRLTSRQPIAGVQVLALGEHVDYWDQLGWRDRFSSATFSARQSDYDAVVFRTGSIYTPQLVIDGRLQRLGSDSLAVQRAIEEAARAPKAKVTVATRLEGQNIHVGIVVDVPPALTIHASDLLIVITQDNLKTDVREGENGGRILKHEAVVRHLETIGALPPQARSWQSSALIPIPTEWVPEHGHVVGLLQERASRHIIGAGASTFR